MGDQELLDFASFVRTLVPRLRAPVEGVMLREDTTLFDELALDSMQAFELILVTEEIADLLLPPVQMPSMYTLGDVYRYYVACTQPA